MTWWLLAVWQLLFVVGDLLFDSTSGCGRPTLPLGRRRLLPCRVSAAGPPCWCCSSGPDPGRDRASLIDATIVATGLGLLSWVFLMKPAATDSTLTVLGRVISIAYPAADVLLLALVARRWSAPGCGTRFQLLAGPCWSSGR